MSDSDEIYRNDIFYEDSDLNEDSEEIEYLKYNLTVDIIRFNKNNFYKMRSNSIINSENISRSDDISDKTYYKNHEEINEVKYNIIMKIFNECIFDETMYSSVIRDKDITFYFRRLVVQKFNISIHEGEKKIFCGEKNYSFIPIDEDSAKNCQFYLGNDAINIEYFDKKIIKLVINDHEIKGFSSIDFQNKYKIDVPTKIKSKGGKSKKSEKGKKSNDNTSKDNNKQTNTLLDNTKNDDKSDNQSVIQQYNFDKDKLIKSEDSYTEEFSGDSLYVKDDNNKDSETFTRFYFLDNYDKEIDGIYTSHKDIHLNISNTVDFPNLEEKIDINKPENDLYGSIIFKNFESDTIFADEPIILEMAFSLFDLMSQIKQISKIVNNTSKEKKYINLPRHVIGILCNHDPNSGTREMAKLNIPYFNDEKITFLKHTINVIQKNNVNVVICVIKGKINGYPLGIEDYEIEDEKLKYRVDLPYMYKKIAGKDIEPEKLEELKNKLKRYRSINSQKMHYIELTDEEYKNFLNFFPDKKNNNSFSLENANKKISELENVKVEFENKDKEFENEIKEFENKNKELVNKNKAFENEIKDFENENKQKDLKILELMKKLNEYEIKEKQNQQNQQNQQKNNQKE